MYRAPEKISRNAPCPCGSGKRYKKCCLPSHVASNEPDDDLFLPQLARRLSEGYLFHEAGQSARAADCWLPLWQYFRTCFRPGRRTFDDPSVTFAEDEVPMSEWVQDFVVALLSASVHDRRYAEIGISVCEDVLAQFTDEDEYFLLSFGADLGAFHEFAGRFDEAERIFVDIIRVCPDSALGYVRLSDMLAHRAPNDDPEHPDRQRACALLEHALARPVVDATDFDVELRLAGLRAS